MTTYLSATEIAKKAGTTPDVINALATRWHWVPHLFGGECCYKDTLAAKLCEYVALDLVPPKDVMQRLRANTSLTQSDAAHLFFGTAKRLNIAVYNRGLYNSGVTRADAERVVQAALLQHERTRVPVPVPAPAASKPLCSMRDLERATGRSAATLIGYAKVLKLPSVTGAKCRGRVRLFTAQEAKALVDMAQQRRQAMNVRPYAPPGHVAAAAPESPKTLALLRSISEHMTRTAMAADEISRFLARQDAAWKQVGAKLDALLAVWAPPATEKLEKIQDQTLLEAAVEGNGEEHT